MTKTLHFSQSPCISLNLTFSVWHVHRDANQFLLSAAHLIDFRVRKKVKPELAVNISPVCNVLNTSVCYTIPVKRKVVCVHKEMDSVCTCSCRSLGYT